MVRLLISLVTLLTFATALFSLAVAQDASPGPTAAEEEEAPRSASQIPLDVLLKANGDLPIRTTSSRQTHFTPCAGTLLRQRFS